MSVVSISNLTKIYGEKKALDNLSFSVNKGEILGFLGANGAGKTTMMNILVGYIPATEGTFSIEANYNIGYLPELPPLYLELTVREYLEFVYGIKKCTLPKTEHINEVLGMVQLSEVENRLIRNLSKGYRQRVGIAQALVGNPEILIFDEPTVGLDPLQIIEVRDLIRELSKGHTVILSSHIMQEIEAVATRVVIIDHGKLIANGALDELRKDGEKLEDAYLRLVIAAQKGEMTEAVIGESVEKMPPPAVALEPQKKRKKQKDETDEEIIEIDIIEEIIEIEEEPKAILKEEKNEKKAAKMAKKQNKKNGGGK